MKSISEELRSVSLQGFKKTGVYKDDIKRFCEFCGRKLDKECPEKIGLRLALGEPMAVHQITDGVCKKIMNVRIENLPDDYPLFLKSPFLVEAKPGNYLFEDIHTIGGYINDEGTFNVIAYCNDNSILIKKDNPFDGTAISEINFTSPDDAKLYYQYKAKNIYPFIIILSLMLEAEKSPISVDSGNKKSKKRKDNKRSAQASWIERRIYIDARYYSPKREENNPQPIDKNGKIKHEVTVQGFLRRQPHGPGNKLRKWIYIEDFKSSRWYNEGDRKTILDIKGIF